MSCIFYLFGFSTEPSKIEIEKRLKSLTKTHPRIYLTFKKIEFIKSRLNKYPYSKFWKYVKKVADIYAKKDPPATVENYDESNIKVLGDCLPYMAIAFLLTNNQLYLKGIKKWMNAVCDYPNWASNKDLGAAHILWGMAICYDWMYDKFTAEEKKLYKEKIRKHSNIFYHLLVSQKKWWAKSYLQNHNYTNVMSLGIAGLALYPEVEEAKDWLWAARQNFRYVLYWLSPDGATHEGVSYWSSSLRSLLAYFMAMAPIYGLEDVKSSQFFQNTSYFRLYMSLPDFVHNVNYADSRYYDYRGPGYILRCLAGIFNNGYAQWLAEKIESVRGKRARCSWLDLIWYDEKVKPLAPYTLPSYSYFENLGIFVSRTGWSSDSVWTFFKAGPPLGRVAYLKNFYGGAGHVHPDEGNFLLWAYGKWLIVDEGYTYLKSTTNHNVFLFNNKGQLGEGKKWFNKHDVIKYKGMANIIYLDATNTNYKYIVADISKIYPPNAGLKKWVRTLIILPKGYLIVRDDIVLKYSGYAESNIHLGLGGVKKIKGGWLYQNGNVSLYIHKLYGNFKGQVVRTSFIGIKQISKNKVPISQYTLKFLYKGKDICSILLFRPIMLCASGKTSVILEKSDKKLVKFQDDYITVRINFVNRQVQLIFWKDNSK